MSMRQVFLAMTGLALLGSMQPAAAAPSFDCAKASNAVERRLCSDDGLARQDRLMAATYKKALKVQGRAEAKEIRASQRAWAKSRSAQCPDAGVACLNKLYQKRLAVLRPMSFANLRLHDGVNVQFDRRAPLVCLSFDALLLPKQAAALDSYVESAGGEALAARARGSELCVEGLAHGGPHRLTVHAGLAGEGAVLRKTRVVEVKIPDRPRRVAFPSRGLILPRLDAAGLPIETVNMASARVLILRVDDADVIEGLQTGLVDQQVNYSDVGRIASRIGQNVWTGEVAIENRPNQAVRTAIPISDVAPKLQAGVYLAVAEDPDARIAVDWWAAAQWFVVSDIGLTAFVGEDGLTVAARALSTSKAAADVKIVLKARGGATLAEAATGTDGMARIGAGHLRGRQKNAPRAVYAYGAAGDFVYLDLSRAPLDLSDRGVDGRQAPGALDAYVKAERGVYRPGETVYLTALVRDRAAAAVEGLPLTLKIVRQDGLEVVSRTLQDKGAGGYSADIPLAASAATGMWRASVHAGPDAPAIGRTSFLVEDFTPPRLEMSMDASARSRSVEAAIKADFLYGAPGADLPGELIVDVRPAAQGPEGFEDYRFGQAQEEAPQSYRAAREEFVTAADGTATVGANLGAWPSTSYPLEAVIRASLFDVSGRPINARATTRLRNLPVLIGLKPLFEDDAIAEGGVAAFDVMAFDAAGAPIPRRLEYSIVREDVEYIWFQSGGRWDYEVQYLDVEVIDAGETTLDGATPQRIARRFDDWGGYRIDVSDPATGLAASVRFHAGWRSPAVAATEPQPDKVKVTLPAGPFAPGQTVAVMIEPPFDAEIMASVIDGQVRATETARIPASGGELRLTLPDDGAGGAYILVNAFAKADGERSAAPKRAIGAAWAAYDTRSKSLEVAISAPAETLPGRAVDIRVSTGVAAGERAFVTLAAVDDGVLGLTGYRSPDPKAHFLGKRRLGMDIWDMYGRFIDAAGAAVGRVRSGGDAELAMRKAASADLPKKSTRVVAMFSGVVEAGPDGTALVPLVLPEFSGRLRLMAQAWSAKRVGAAETTMLARRPTVAALTLPRFMAPGDVAKGKISLRNLSGPAGAYAARLTVDGVARASNGAVLQAELKPGGPRAELGFDLAAIAPGDIWLTLEVTGPGGAGYTIERSLSVRPASQMQTRRFVARVPPGGSLTAPDDLAAGLYPASTRTVVGLNPLPDLDLPGILLGLARYPYGCAEQTTSTATPLLYAEAVAASVGMQTAARPKDAIEKGVSRLLGMQTYSGGFGFWDSRYEAPAWTTAYVTDFLTQAAAAGYEVPAAPLARALGRLDRLTDQALRQDRGYAASAYAAYVRAKAGAAEPARIRRFADALANRQAPAIAYAFAGAALAAVGDAPAARLSFQRAGEGGKARLANRYETYGSAIRDLAVIAALSAESGLFEWPALETVADRLSKHIAERRWLSTQEQAWIVRAAAALGDAAETDGFAIEIDGARVAGPGAGLYRSVAAGEAAPRFRNLGAHPATGEIVVTGAPLTPPPATDAGFAVERTLYDEQGDRLDAAKVRQNDLVVVVLTGKKTRKGRARALLVDYLPAGLELENTRLGGAGLGGYGWLTGLTPPEHVELRDDRFVAAFDAYGDTTFRIAYLARAVTPGRFSHAGAYVEAMYRPAEHGRSAPGGMTVFAR